MKRLGKIIVSMFIVAGCGWVGLNAYRNWHATRIIEQATAFLQQGRLDKATHTLATVPAVARSRPEFLQLQARFFSTKGDAAGAEKTYEELLSLEKGGGIAAQSARLNLAQLMLNTQLPAEADKAARLIESVAGGDPSDPAALRMMAQRALQKGDVEGALGIAWKLGRSPGAQFNDYLLQLDIMMIGNSPLVESALVPLEQAVMGNPANEARLAKWLLDRKGAARSVAWLESLPEVERMTLPVSIMLTSGYAATQNWQALAALLIPENWSRLEPQRQAYLSLAYRRLGQEANATAAWKAALRTAKDEPGAMANLARMAESWGRTDDTLQALWGVSLGDPNRLWARGRLFTAYRLRNDAGNLIRLMNDSLVEHSDSIPAKRSLASLLLITNREQNRAIRLAKEVYAVDPGTMQNVTLYAYSLYAQGNAEAAAALIDARSSQEKSSKECLPYYGVILAACGRKEEARKCFRDMDRSVLFPEMEAKISSIESHWN